MESEDIFKINKIQISFVVFFITLFVIGKVFFTPTEPLEPRAQIPLPDPFANLQLDTQSAYVFDVTTGTPLFSYNAETQLPLASVTKVMTAVVASELVPRETIIVVDGNAVAQEGDTGLLSGEQWRLTDLLDLTLIASSNDGARAIATTLGALQNIYITTNNSDTPATEGINQANDTPTSDSFIELMNQAAIALGMTQTFFLNESGLDTNEILSGAYGSAKDMAILFDYILKTEPNILEATRYQDISLSSLNDIDHTVENTNKAISALPAVIASKTGFTDLAGGNLVIAFEAGPMHPIIVSVLGSGIDTRFDDVEKLVWASLEKITQK